jgi:capsular exopolysaccharide synthesis family protein
MPGLIPSNLGNATQKALSRAGHLDLIRILRQGWRFVAFSVLVFLTLAVIYSVKAKRLYQATTRLLVLQQGGPPLPGAGGESGRLIGGDDYLPTHAAVIRSPMVVARAIEKVGLDDLPTPRAARDAGRDPIQEVIDNLPVSRPDRAAQILRLDYQAGSREEAVRTLAAITESYEEFLEDKYQKNNSEVVTLISSARDSLKKEIEGLERGYLEFRQTHPISTTDESGRSFMSRRVDQWDRLSNDAMVREVQLKSQLELGRELARDGAGFWAILHAMNKLGGDPGDGLLARASDPFFSGPSDYVRQLSREQQELAERYGPQYSKVQELQNQITRIQERMRESRNRLDQSETRDLLGALEKSLMSIVAMRAEVGRHFDADLDRAKKAENDLLTEANLRSNLERHRALFNTLVEQLKRAQLVGDYSSISSQVIEPPNALPWPVRPRVALIMALALAVGLCAGTGVAFLADRADERLRTVDEVRKVLDLPVLGVTPLLVGDQAGGMASAGLISHVQPWSPASEAYRAVRTNVELLRRSQRLQVILVTSPCAGDGKSTTASNLAISLAHAGRRVLLVDADLRRPTQDRIHDQARDRGLVHILKDLLPFHRVVKRSSIPSLDLVLSGPDCSNPAELLMKPELDQFLASVRETYDAVIIDSSPLLAVTDATIIGAVADGIVLVVRPGTVHRRDAERSMELLKSLGTPVVGTVINGGGREHGGYGYGYGYGAAGRDGVATVALAPGEEARADGDAPDPGANGHAVASGDAREPDDLLG